MSERMTHERLAFVRRAYSVDTETPFALQVMELISEIDALRAELAEAREIQMPNHDINNLDDVVSYLGIAESDMAPVEAIKRLVAQTWGEALEEAANIVTAHYGKDIETHDLPGKIRALSSAT